MIDKPWLKSYDPGLPHSLQPYPYITMLDVLSDAARQRPDGQALVFKGRWITYDELEQITDAFGAALVAIGVAPGERVMLMLPNSPQAIIAQYGAWKAKAIVCPVNPLYTEWELEHAIKECVAETEVVL